MRCRICGSGRLSPVGELASGERRGENLRLKFPRRGVLKPRPVFEARLGRACRDCGALLPFLDEYGRQQLDAVADDLTDAEGAPAPPYGAPDCPGQ
ncbi:hypothetical protein [Streptomyces sp. NPDC006739]|uniref:hypothetical protein n=1 Tax=Streptomyces sp. NPDC006739 TaxID=3364763 RepID=UPI0036914648